MSDKLGRPVLRPVEPEKPQERPGFRVTAAALARSRAGSSARRLNPSAAGFATDGAKNLDDAPDPWRLPDYPPGVLPKGVTAKDLAMDDFGNACAPLLNGSWAGLYAGMWAEGVGFMGYPYLAELTQRPEYRRPSEVYAEEMTRKWLRITATGKGDRTDRVNAIEAAFKKFNVRRTVRDLIKMDGYLGRANLFLDTGSRTRNDPEALKSPLVLKRRTFPKGSLKAIRAVDPTWTAPNNYNSGDPLSPNFYRPDTWFVMGKEVHATRFIPIVSRPVPDILKPAYNFGGLALSQMMKPYVDNWLRTRQSVSDIIQSFTVWVIETNMAAFMAGGDVPTIENRAEFFANLKNNFGLMFTDKETESFQNVSAPLGGLDHLQAQAQEHMAAVSGEPLVKMTGITPSGLNAGNDSEMRVWYDAVNARQVEVLDPLIEALIIAFQLNEFGDVDEEIVHEWVPLYQLDEAGKASVRKTNADEAAVWIESGVIDPDEARDVLREDPESPYAGLEGPAPEPPEPLEGGEGGGGELPGGGKVGLSDPSAAIGKAGEQGSHSGANAGDGLARDAGRKPLFGGHWVTTEENHRVYIKNGKVEAGFGGKETGKTLGEAVSGLESKPEAPKPEAPKPEAAKTEAPKPEALNFPDPGDEWYKQDLHKIASDPDTAVMERISKLKSSINPNATTAKIAYINSLIKALGGNSEAAKTEVPNQPPMRLAGGEVHRGSDLPSNVKRLFADSSRVPSGWFSKVTAAYVKDGQESIAANTALENYADKVYSSLSSADQEFVDGYKDVDYIEIAEYLRTGKTFEAYVPKAVTILSRCISRSFVPADTRVYRGMSVSLGQLVGTDNPEEAVGKTFIHKNFVSTSRSVNVARGFAESGVGSTGEETAETSAAAGAGLVLEMDLDAGTPGLVMRGQGKSDEREILLNKGAAFKITGVRKDDKGVSHVSVVYVGDRQ